jgi:hypothetical protein
LEVSRIIADELATITRIGGDNVDAVSRATDLPGRTQRVCLEHGTCHYGNGKARANAWYLPDAVPVHREPTYRPRPDLVAKYPTRPDERQFRIPNIGFTVQRTAGVERGIARDAAVCPSCFYTTVDGVVLHSRIFPRRNTRSMGATVWLKENCPFVRRCVRPNRFLLADGDIVARISKERVVTRGYSSGA